MTTQPDPVRRLESHGVVDNLTPEKAECEHRMESIKTGSDLVPFVEQCSLCFWIDPVSLTWWAEDAVKKSLTKRATRIAVALDTEPFSFVQQDGEELTLDEMVFQALGAASVCWENPAGAGLFDSSRAKSIGDRLLAEVKRAAAAVPARSE